MSNATLKPPSKVITGFTDSSPLLTDLEKLHARADEDGFLFFKGMLPKEVVLELRGQILEIVDRYGWLKKGADRMDGIGDLEAIAQDDANDPRWKYIGVGEKAYEDVQSLELFHALQHHPKLIALYEKLFHAGVLPHPRAIARVLLPAPSLAPTPPHQDYIYIQGTHNFWTCWFPLGDCPIELGGLSVLKGSHREKVLDVSAARGAGGAESHLCGLDYTWVQDDYECGDVITFPSHMVHKALPNQFRDKIRLSCDYRFQSIEEEIDPSSLAPHMASLGWDDLYRGWKNDGLKYYWKSNSLKSSVWDPKYAYSNIKEKIC